MRFSLVERLSVIAGVFALMIGIGISSVGIVSAARGLSGHSCSSKNACASYTNTKSGPGIQGKSTGTGGIGVSGLSTSGAGVYGESQSVNSSGVYGDATSSGTGVYGISNAGYGVWGTSSSSDGVYGTSYYGDGVYGSSTLALGVYGYSKSATGAYFENDSNGAPTLRAVADSNTPPLEVSSVASGGSFEVDSTGDGIFSGEVEATAFIEDQEERGGSRVGAFSSESTSATIEDTGTARLEGGEGAVRF